MLDGTEHFDCDCGNIEHELRFNLDLDERVIYVDACMDNCHTMWERMKVAWDHVRGKDNETAFHDKIIQFADVERMRGMLEQIANRHHAAPEACNLASDDNRLHFYVDRMADDMPHMLMVDTYLARRDRWSLCVWYAIKYVFGYKSRYGVWDCFEMDAECATALLHQIRIWEVELEKLEKVTTLSTNTG